MTTQFDQMPASIRKPGKYFEFNIKLANRTLPQNKQKLLFIGQRLKALISPASFQGGTLNDMTSQGTYTGTVKKNFQVKISTAGTPDDFDWSSDGGKTWTTGVAVTGSAQSLEDGVTVTFAATTGHAVDDQYNFSSWSEPSVAENVPTTVFSDNEVAEKFGYGSVAHIMAIAAIKANPYIDMTVCAMDDAGSAVASAGSITIANTATSSGSLKVWIGNKKIEIGIANADTPAVIALTLDTEMAKYPELPVMSTIDQTTAGKINFTAKNGGTLGEQIGIAYEITALAVTATVVAMTGGATDPDITSPLAAVFAEQYNIIATAYNDQTSLVALRDHLDTVSGPLEQRGGIAYWGTTGSYAASVTMSSNINSGMMENRWSRGSRSLPYEVAAGSAADTAGEEDPARPLNGREIKGLHVPAIDQRPSRAEVESALWNGVSPLVVGSGEKIQVERAISSYTENGQGIDDPALLDITTMRTLFYFRKACRDRVALRFPREKLYADTAKENGMAKKVWTELYDVALKLEEIKILEKVEENKDGLIVERSLTDPNRLDAKIPADVVNGFHVLAARIDLLL